VGAHSPTLENQKGGPFLALFQTAAPEEVPLLVCNTALLWDGRLRFRTPWLCGDGERGKNHKPFKRLYKLL